MSVVEFITTALNASPMVLSWYKMVGDFPAQLS